MDGKWERDQRQKEGEEGCSLLSLAPRWTTADQVHGSLPSPLLDLLPPCSFRSNRSPLNASPGAPYHPSEILPSPAHPSVFHPFSPLFLVKRPAVPSRCMQALISIKVESTLTSTLGEKVLESDCEGSTEEACRGVLDSVIPPLSLAGPSAHKEAKESR